MSSMLNMFKKNSPHDERKGNTFVAGGRRAGESDNPYLSARRTWNSITGSTVASRRMWMFVGCVACCLLLVSVGGIIHIGSQSKFVPYVIEVDKVGNAVASGPIKSSTVADPRIIKSTVAEFVTDARLVTPDVALQRAAIFRIYSRLSPNDPATQKMNEWLNGSSESSPFNRAKRVIVNIEIKSVLPQTPDTWQIDWVETMRDRNGGIVDKPVTYRALVTVYVAAPSANTTEEQIRMNPLGIYISDFSWQKLL